MTDSARSMKGEVELVETAAAAAAAAVDSTVERQIASVEHWGETSNLFGS